MCFKDTLKYNFGINVGPEDVGTDDGNEGGESGDSGGGGH